MKPEEWRAVPGWEGIYEVSDQGSARSLPRVVITTAGKRCPIPGKLLTACPDGSGYPSYTLCRPGTRKTVKAHVLVLTVFVGPRPSPEIDGCHNDGNPMNNVLVNLRWDTKSANVRDNIRNGTNFHAAATECVWGHPFDEANTYVTKRGGRQCRACRRRSSAAFARRKREQVAA